MDTSGFSQIGRYGTISLLKRNEEHSVVTSFGIDTEELTFGRETTCGVRLYYPDVALLHCKVMFEERKAFLVVLGESGVFVDGCKVFPRTSNNLSTIIPLANNSEFEIHGKRFRFSYPPKEIRAALFATPARPQNRALRLSMIHSAQVFTPSPSKDPRENLRILQSPLKNSFKSPVKAAPQEEDKIILVQGNHPRVVQEERDLVILEDVALVPPSPSKLPQTPPRRKSLGGNALHRAVLIRSAQRAILKAETEREEEEEEMEVLGAVVDADDEEGYEDNEREDVEMNSPTQEDDDFLDDTEQSERNDQKPLWRKSLEKIIWPFGSSEENAQDINDTDDGGHTEDDEYTDVPPSTDLSSSDANFRSDELEGDEDQDESEIPAPLPLRSPQHTPIRRTLGSFMTPQAKYGPLPPTSNAPDARPAIGRLSLGGGEARRVVIQQPWRVRDLVIPPLVATPSTSTQSPEKVANSSVMTVQTPKGVMASPERTRTPARPTLTEEERKAIQERRRSALKEPSPFFPGGAPGLTPGKPKSLNGFSSPVKVGASGLYNSPMKGHIIHEDVEMEDKDTVQEEEEDTRSLLFRMKETVDEMRRRRSVALGITTPYTERLSHRPSFAPVVTPRSLFQPELREVVDSAEDESNEVREQEPFSLLRPGARDEAVSQLPLAIAKVEPPVEDPIPLPAVVVHPVDDGVSSEMRNSAEVQEQPTRMKEGRSRLLRAPKSIDVAAGPSEPILKEVQEEANSKPKSRSTGPASRSRTPQLPIPEQETCEAEHTTKSSTTAIGDPTVATGRRTRKGTAEPEEQQTTAVPLPPTGKRSRKVPVSEQPQQDVEEPKEKADALSVRNPEDEEQHMDSREGDQRAESSLKAIIPPVRRGRLRKTVQETLDHEGSTLPVPVAAKAGTGKKATTPSGSNTSRIRGTRKAVIARASIQIGEDEDEKPLDSYNAVEEDNEEDGDLPGLPPPSRINKTKTKGRKKAAITVIVKQEQDGENSFSDLKEETPAAKGTTTRASGTKSGGRATPIARTPANKDGGRKTRTKTPATAPASTTSTCISNDKDKQKEKDKENAPGSTGSGGGGGSGKLSPSVSGDGEDSEQTQPQPQGVAVKVRVSRSRGVAATTGGERVEGTTGKVRTGLATATRSASKAIKVEEVEAAAVEPVRATRMRTRTKTG